MNWDKIDNERREAADAEFEGYDFEEYQLEDKSGWEYTSGTGPAEWTRPLFFADPEDPDAETTTGIFRVAFLPGTAEVAYVTASINGNDIGHRPEPQPIP